MFNIEKALMPRPACIEDKGKYIKIGDIASADFCFNANGSGEVFDEAVKYIKKAFAKIGVEDSPCGKYSISLCVDTESKSFRGKGKGEAYFIDITENSAVLCGYDSAGAYYAAITFAQLVFCEGTQIFLPQCFILDSPGFEKRGHFMECRYGSDFLTYEDWKHGIDYLSEMKINTVMCGVYGCWDRQYDGEFAEYLYIPFEKYPQLKTPRNIKYYSAKERTLIYKKNVLPKMFEDDYFGKLIRYGKKKNINVIPLFNSLGHNTLLPRMFPEISAVDANGEHTGIGFCTNNDKTFEIIFNIYDEIIDRYLTPCGIDSFEIGLDEVYPMIGIDSHDLQHEKEPYCKCEKCSGKDYGEIMIEYIIKIAKHMKSKGIKNVYIYHDMLFKHNMLNEDLVLRFKKEDVYDVIVIDWWSYNPRGINFGQHEEAVHGLFRSIGKPITGYFHWNMPTQLNENIYVISEIAKKNNFEGLIAYSSFEYCYDFNYRVLAECAWNDNKAANVDEMLERYAYRNFPDNISEALAALKTEQDYMLGRYSRKNFCTEIFEYYVSSYLRRNMEYPQDYPARQMKLIKDDEEKYLTYLRETYTKADSVYRFFDENTSSHTGEIHKLIAAQYRALCDEFMTIYTCAAQYNEGILDESAFMRQICRLIAQRDDTIALCESVRIEANQFTCIRDMTISRQFICDLRDYMKTEITSGRKPRIDIFSFGKYLSSASLFLR